MPFQLWLKVPKRGLLPAAAEGALQLHAGLHLGDAELREGQLPLEEVARCSRISV